MKTKSTLSFSVIATMAISIVTIVGSLGVWADVRPGPGLPTSISGTGTVESRLMPAETTARREYEMERGITFPLLVRGNPARKEIALTFDDGPHPGKTEQLLDILKQEQVRATFFVVGRMVDRSPELVRREIAEGHEVANHTYSHLRLASASPAAIEFELREGARSIRRATGSPTRLFRPPGGEYDDEVIEATKRLGYVMVLWTDDPGDFAMPGSATIEYRALKGISNGSILLLHDGIQQTYDILPDLIRRLKRQGYRFVTISEMALEGGVIKSGGPRVRPGRIPDLPDSARKL